MRHAAFLMPLDALPRVYLLEAPCRSITRCHAAPLPLYGQPFRDGAAREQYASADSACAATEPRDAAEMF